MSDTTPAPADPGGTTIPGSTAPSTSTPNDGEVPDLAALQGTLVTLMGQIVSAEKRIDDLQAQLAEASAKNEQLRTEVLAAVAAKGRTPVMETIMKHAPRFEPTKEGDVEELEDWEAKTKTFCDNLGVEEAIWVPLVVTFCFKGGSQAAKYIGSVNA